MRVRFAPSPTGYLHVGNARTAVLNYLVAKKHGATYVLRVEDTDMERSSRQSEQSIMEDLRWLGIEWDEGPIEGGQYGPYRQSERFDIYREYTERLLADGHAYHCYCSQEELDELRKQADAEKRPFVYPGTCRNLTDTQVQQFQEEGRKPTVRFRVPDGEVITVDDHIKGKITFNSQHIGGDFIIVRSDGVPIYNYIVIIDDALMKITHVIRGEDHLPNTPKQALVGKALDLPVPEYAHMPLLLGPDRAKLSKRHGITSVAVYRDEGYLPEALFNFLGILGWATESGDEVLAKDDLVEQFEISNLAKSSALFDFQKLRWMNGIYIRDYDLATITDVFIPYMENAGYSLEGIDRGWLESAVDLVRGNCEVLSDIHKHISIFLDNVPEHDEEVKALFEGDEDARKIIAGAKDLVAAGTINADNFATETIGLIKQETSLKGKKLFLPIRAMLTGRLHGPELDRALPLMGFDNFKKRIEDAAGKYLS